MNPPEMGNRPTGESGGAEPGDHQAGGIEVEGSAADRQSASVETYGSRSASRFRRSRAELEALDDAIIEAVELDHPVTLRGVYYRVVSMGAVPKTEAGYRAIGRRLITLRRTGEIPYRFITDGTRYVIHPPSYNGIDEALEEAASSYRRALWTDTGVSVHIFTEKDAITGIVEPVVRQWDVPLGVLRGYCSESFAAQMGEEVATHDGSVYVYNLGDHDPSGADAWRDFRCKVAGFAPAANVTFERLAVTPAQIESLNLPTRPTKEKDTRSKGFRGESVEVDAIPAPELRKIVYDAIHQHIDERTFDLLLSVEESERETLAAIAGEYS